MFLRPDAVGLMEFYIYICNQGCAVGMPGPDVRMVE